MASVITNALNALTTDNVSKLPNGMSSLSTLPAGLSTNILT